MLRIRPKSLWPLLGLLIGLLAPAARLNAQSEPAFSFLHSGSGYSIAQHYPFAGLFATGPNITPWQIESVYYPDQFGASGRADTTTGSIASGSVALALASAIDFSIGQGIAIAHAGAASTLTAPTSLGVTATCGSGLTCTSTYHYKVVALDGAGGMSAASAQVSVANSTTGLTPGQSSNLAATKAYNLVSWAAVSGAAAYVIYGDEGGSTLRIVGASQTNTFYDLGQSLYITSSTWPWIPFAPPSAALSDWLVTSVSAGGGSTLLTLATPASTAASSQYVLHDDGAALRACIAAGLACRIPAGTFNLVNSSVTIGASQLLDGSGPSSVIQELGSAAAIYTRSVGASAQNLTILIGSPAAVAALEVDGESSANNRDSFSSIKIEANANSYRQRGIWLTTGNGNFGNYDNVFHSIRLSRADVPIYMDSPFASLANGWQSPNLNTFSDVHAVYESTCIDLEDGSENSFSGLTCLGGEGQPTYVGAQVGGPASKMGAEYNHFAGWQCDQNSGAGSGICIAQQTPAGNVLDNDNFFSLHDADSSPSAPGSWADSNVILSESGLSGAGVISSTAFAATAVATAALPACSAATVTEVRWVSDSTTNTFGAAPTGGGTWTAPVACTDNNGTYAWLIGG